MANETSLVQTTPAAVVPIIRQSQETRASLQLSPFSNNDAFESASIMAKQLATSSLVPQIYRNNTPNCLIAMELASRIGASVLAVMQNMDIIQGKPGWSAKFLIATVNASGRFTPLRFEWAGEAGKPSWSCRAIAKDRHYGDLCEGAWITWEMAGKEGWTSKGGSKWKTMPQQMFMYRAAAFWVRTYCPELSVGLQTAEELYDTSDGRVTANGTELPDVLTPAGAKALEAVLGLQNEADEQPAQSPVDDQPQTTEAPQQQSSAPVLTHPSLKFGAKFGKEMRGKPFEQGTEQQRKEYIDACSEGLKKQHNPELEKHRDECAALHDAILADGQMGADQ